MLNCSAKPHDSTSILEALPGLLDIKRHSPSILFYYPTVYIRSNCLFLCPGHDNGRGIKCYPSLSVRPYIRMYLRSTYVRLSKQRPLSKSITFDQNFMKLGLYIVKYHDVFFKFDNGPYRTMLSVVMALCLW